MINVDKFISVHTPKASGTSIIAGLRKIFGDLLAIDNSDDPASPLSQRVIDPCAYFGRNRKLGEHTACLHGHFHPGQFDLDGVSLFTMLRHPVDNIVSIYFFWKTCLPHGNPLHDYFVTQELSLIDMAKLPALRFLYSEIYFGGFDMDKFSVVGRYDDRPEYFRSLKYKLGLELDSSIELNVTVPDNDRGYVLSDHKLIRVLQDILKEDMLFYERHAF